jgi:Acetyltransferase (GNAT) domain
MHTYLVDNITEAEDFIRKMNGFAHQIGSTLLAHRLQPLLVWWKHFSTKDGGEDFGRKRGRNCLGHKSWLRKIVLIITEKEDMLLGIAPLLISEVQLKGEKQTINVLSFCPDSVMFFYQDFLIHPQYRKMAVSQLFEHIKDMMQRENLFLFLGHIPDDSLNLAHIRYELSLSLKEGWTGGEATNCRRGGVYPWNLAQLSRILKASLNEPECDSALKTTVQDIMQLMDRQTTALLVFSKTRKDLEKKLQDVADTFRSHPTLSDYAQKISDSIVKKPIVYPYLTLPNSAEDLYSGLSSSKRYFYKRYMKRYCNAGGSFENVSPDNITPSDIEEYLSLHSSRWHTESAAITDKTRGFHKELCLNMAEKGYFRLFFANYNGKRIAVLSCFDIGNRREFYYSGREMESLHLRAGKLIVLHSILDAIQNGFEIFDFGYGGDAYKFDFTKDYKTLKSFFLTKQYKIPESEKLFPMYEDIGL